MMKMVVIIMMMITTITLLIVIKPSIMKMTLGNIYDKAKVPVPNHLLASKRRKSL